MVMALNQCDIGSTSCLHAQRMKKNNNNKSLKSNKRRQ